MADGSTAFLFPGQGAQSAGMGRALASAHPGAAELFRSADAVLGYRLSRICFEGPESELQLTANAQPAILTVSIAAARALAERAVHRRGLYMQEAVPVGEGAMAALLGIEAVPAEEICAAAEGEGLGVVSVANDNAPGQIVIAGRTAAVERAIVLAKDRGARRAMRLPVSAPFHCELMAPARDRLAADLEKLAFRDLAIPLVTNVDAAPIRAGAEARASLVRQVTGRVRWAESVRRLRAMGADRAIECGPGQVLAGLVKRIDPGIRIVSCGDPETLDAAATLAAGR